MLVLTRKVHESMILGEDHGPYRVLKVTVLAVEGQRVKLGFEMDNNVSVQRWELWKGIRNVSVQAAPDDEPELHNGSAARNALAWRADCKDAFDSQGTLPADG